MLQATRPYLQRYLYSLKLEKNMRVLILTLSVVTTGSVKALERRFVCKINPEEKLYFQYKAIVKVWGLY